MASLIYDKALEEYPFPDILTDDVKVVLIKNTYVPNSSTDQFLSSIALGEQIALSAVLASKTFAAGLFDAADFSFGAVAGADVCDALAVFHSTGVDATSELLCYIDDYGGLPLTTDGSAISVTWSSGGILQI